MSLELEAIAAPDIQLPQQIRLLVTGTETILRNIIH
jgi:hypothetical protein